MEDKEGGEEKKVGRGRNLFEWSHPIQKEKKETNNSIKGRRRKGKEGKAKPKKNKNKSKTKQKEEQNREKERKKENKPQR